MARLKWYLDLLSPNQQKTQKTLDPTENTFVDPRMILILYASSAGSGESLHLCRLA